jgi:proteasome-associated ATPase
MTPQDETMARKLLGRLTESIPSGDAKLTMLVGELGNELTRIEARELAQEQQLAEFEAAYEKLTSPANRIAVLLAKRDDDTALLALGETEYVAQIDPSLLKSSDLVIGARVMINEGYAVVGILPPHSGGGIGKVADLLGEDRLKIGNDQPGSATRIVWRGSDLLGVVVKKGDEVRIEPTGKVAVELFGQQDARDYFLEEVPQTPWSNIGGQDEAIKMIRETIELPLLHPELFAKFEKKPIKGVLLYGPPGCGKTLIGKAIAYNLAKEYSERLGREVKECFLNISGPKILNMWLGESERMVREIFDTARTKAKEGNLVVIFIDEAESILRTRSSGRYMNISNTVVPQFCAEMDGVMGLENVIVVLTSNRPDYIDPAILRPERIDRKVKITRPDLNSAKSILSIYLNENLPIDPVLVKEFDNEPACARKELIESTMTYLFRKEKATEFLKVSLRNGSNETLYFKDLLSGALLKSLVDRAKDTAIKRAIENPKTEQGLSKEDMQAAIDAEFSENEIFPKNDVVEDWLKLIDFDIENVVNVRPVKTTKGEAFVRKNIL